MPSETHNSARRTPGSPRTAARRTALTRRPLAVLALLFGLLAAAAAPAAAAGLSVADEARPAPGITVAAAPRTTADETGARTLAAAAAPTRWRHTAHSGSTYHHVTHQTSFSSSHDKPKKKKMGFFKKLGIFLIVIIVVIIVIVILLIWLIVHFIRKAFRRRD
ncbi:hypothetical protein ADL22_18080 [Streptomyces sp. NRRL F-4489]|uniref:hypothetical protein n=1 Tax=Streptomyces sp. NRRL F-4489 TaxID=1609095 RepID=UPI0007486B0A|nr:hypothetical protein [Streptomyces sp. NRRL F-4489]KUL38549.1 hypothetical protein ADL22_18080 [Streptomyces sp. NRRL F-4489]